MEIILGHYYDNIYHEMSNMRTYAPDRKKNYETRTTGNAEYQMTRNNINKGLNLVLFK